VSPTPNDPPSTDAPPSTRDTRRCPVSVVIPTRNRHAMVVRAVRSVLAQSHDDLEVVVVDDGGDDGTPEALARLGDDRVVVHRLARCGGVSAARNAGIARAGGDAVAWCDDDDVWGPGKLRRQVEALQRDGAAGWSTTGAAAVTVDDTGTRVLWVSRPPAADAVLDALLGRNAIPGGGSGVLARRDLLAETGGFDPGLSLLADWDLWTRFALASPCSPAPELCVGYVVHAASMSARGRRLGRELTVLRDRYRDARVAHGVPMAEAWMRRWALDAAFRDGTRAVVARELLTWIGADPRTVPWRPMLRRLVTRRSAPPAVLSPGDLAEVARELGAVLPDLAGPGLAGPDLAGPDPVAPDLGAPDLVAPVSAAAGPALGATAGAALGTGSAA
jgi:glycosyltransferase involved in cell wall biosynthesis